MYPIGKVWLNVCSQADDGKSNAGDMQGRSQCREEKYIYIYTNNEKVPPCTFPLQNEGTCVS